jgi:4-hydroxy-2-oxoheptanedioate aldolase
LLRRGNLFSNYKRPMPARLSARLSSSLPLTGLVLTSPNPPLIRTAGECGYDFLFIDQEHGLFSGDEYLRTVESVSVTAVLAMARLARHDMEGLQRCAMAGADAIVIPHVSTAEEARALARAMEDAPRCASLFVIIESALGVQNASTILAVDGVDGAFVGPTDLSTDLGCRKDYSQPAYTSALARVEQAAATTGKLLGTAVHAGHSFSTLAARRYHMVVIDTDAALLREAMTVQLAALRPRRSP